MSAYTLPRAEVSDFGAARSFRPWKFLVNRLRRAEERQRNLRALSRLDDRMLRDLGVTREEFEVEVRRFSPF